KAHSFFHSFFHLVSLPEDRGDVERVSRIVHSMTTSDSTFYSINTTKFVRFGSKADILGGLRDVRFTPESRHRLTAWVCVAKMLAQQNTKPAHGPRVHHFEGVP